MAYRCARHVEHIGGLRQCRLWDTVQRSVKAISAHKALHSYTAVDTGFRIEAGRRGQLHTQCRRPPARFRAGVSRQRSVRRRRLHRFGAGPGPIPEYRTESGVAGRSKLAASSSSKSKPA
jgi:hypothetical protein